MINVIAQLQAQYIEHGWWADRSILGGSFVMANEKMLA